MRRLGDLTLREFYAMVWWLLWVRHTATCPSCQRVFNVPIVPGADNG